MARDGRHDRRGMAYCVSCQAQTRRWILVLPRKQCPLVVWGWHDKAYALITLQFALAILNFRGVYKNEPESAEASDS